ncbi:MAG: tetratricopeptide (TPR) repeat protein [Paracoccaceae bacterium]|jgi:tetratricopeptide (TPR) repeat protein
MIGHRVVICAMVALCGCAQPDAPAPAGDDLAAAAALPKAELAPGTHGGGDPGDRVRVAYDASIAAQVEASAAAAAAVVGPAPDSVDFFKPRMAIPEGAILDPMLVAGPQGDELWADLGVRLLRIDSFDASLRAFSRSMAREGVGLRNVLGASAAMRGLGRLNQARRLLETALRSWPESASLRNNLGVLLHAMGRPEDGARELRVALALTGRNPHESMMAPVVERNLGMALMAIELAHADDPPPPPPPVWNVAVLGAGHYALIASERSE